MVVLAARPSCPAPLRYDRVGCGMLREPPMGRMVFWMAWLLVGWAAPAHALIISPPLSGNEYESLRSELMARIPEYAPGWTDYSDSDPGVTLLELFAFTAENLMYRVELDLSSDLLWEGFDPEDESTQGSVAYTLADAAWLLRYENIAQPKDWLALEGIDIAWTYMELRTAAVQAVPEPGPPAVLVTGIALAGLRWRRHRRARSSPDRPSLS